MVRIPIRAFLGSAQLYSKRGLQNALTATCVEIAEIDEGMK